MSQASKGARLRVRVTPKAGANRIDGVERDSAGLAHLKVRVRAVADKGAANAALVALLARELGAARSSVRVVRGTASRIKLVDIDGVDAAAIEARLQAYGPSA